MILFYMFFPVIVLIPASFISSSYVMFPPPGFSLRWYQEFLSDPIWIESALLSLEISVLTAVVTVIVGGLASMGLVRGDFRGKDLLSLFIVSPMIVPAILFAVAEFFTLTAMGLKGTLVGFVLVYVVLALPRVVSVIASRLQSFDVALEEAARNLGASRWQAYMRITVPIIAPAVFTAALFAFHTAFNETIVAVFISGPGFVTLPRQMYNAAVEEANLTVAAVSALQVVATVIILGSSVLLGRDRS